MNVLPENPRGPERKDSRSENLEALQKQVEGKRIEGVANLQAELGQSDRLTPDTARILQNLATLDHEAAENIVYDQLDNRSQAVQEELEARRRVLRRIEESQA